MKISDVIAGLTDIQNHCRTQGFSTAQASELCRLTINLAAHVQQLEIDMRSTRMDAIGGNVPYKGAVLEVLNAATAYVEAYRDHIFNTPEMKRLQDAVKVYKGLR